MQSKTVSACPEVIIKSFNDTELCLYKKSEQCVLPLADHSLQVRVSANARAVIVLCSVLGVSKVVWECYCDQMCVPAMLDSGRASLEKQLQSPRTAPRSNCEAQHAQRTTQRTTIMDAHAFLLPRQQKVWQEVQPSGVWFVIRCIQTDGRYSDFALCGDSYDLITVDSQSHLYKSSTLSVKRGCTVRALIA